MYRITMWQRPRIFQLELSELWTLETFAGCERAVADALARSGWAPGSYDCLIDARHHPTQSKEVAERVRLSHLEGPLRPMRNALVANGALMKMQAERILPPGTATSARLEDACRWLGLEARVDALA